MNLGKKMQRIYDGLSLLWDKIVSDEVNATLAAMMLLLAFVVLPTLFVGDYSDTEFLWNIWANINAMVVDILVLGLFVKLVSRVGARRREVQRYLNEIDDFRGWSDQIAAHRIRGNIKRLNQLGVTKIDLTQCYLAEAQLENIKLRGSKLVKTNLIESDLENADLQMSDAWNAHFDNASLIRIDLSGANLNSATLTSTDLSGAIMKGTSLKGSDLSHADLSGAIIDNADMTDVQGLEPSQLSGVKSAANIKISEALLASAKSINPAPFP